MEDAKGRALILWCLCEFKDQAKGGNRNQQNTSRLTPKRAFAVKRTSGSRTSDLSARLSTLHLLSKTLCPASGNPSDYAGPSQAAYKCLPIIQRSAHSIDDFGIKRKVNGL